MLVIVLGRCVLLSWFFLGSSCGLVIPEAFLWAGFLRVFFSLSLSLSRWSSAKYLLGGNASDQSHRFFSISSLG